MSHKTAYKTFSNPDLNALEVQVNDYLKELRKKPGHESVKIHDVSTFFARDAYVATLAYSYVKKKKPVAEAGGIGASISETGSMPGNEAAGTL